MHGPYHWSIAQCTFIEKLHYLMYYILVLFFCNIMKYLSTVGQTCFHSANGLNQHVDSNSHNQSVHDLNMFKSHDSQYHYVRSL